MIRIAELWEHLPPHIREAIQTLVDAATTDDRISDPATPSRPEFVAKNEVAWRLARECRSIVQACLREEEWQDADEEFHRIIAEGIGRWQ